MWETKKLFSSSLSKLEIFQRKEKKRKTFETVLNTATRVGKEFRLEIKFKLENFFPFNVFYPRYCIEYKTSFGHYTFVETAISKVGIKA
jgi:hypothetical protein